MTDAGGATWTATTYTSDEGQCLEIAGQDSGEAGSVIGCGEPTDGSFHVGQGGVDIDGTFYRVVYGTSPKSATDVKVTLKTGSVVPAGSSVVTNGVWFAVYPGTATDPDADVDTVHLKDAAGAVVDSASPPAISAYARAAAALQATQ